MASVDPVPKGLKYTHAAMLQAAVALVRTFVAARETYELAAPLKERYVEGW
jgi:hypothetical protein